MIKILFFAHIREVIKTKELLLIRSNITVAELKQELASRGEKWKLAFEERIPLCAVNQRLVDSNYLIKAGDEVAFFPPVTGG